MDTNPVNLAKMAVNKMKYKLFQAAYDPEAEKMAATEKKDKEVTKEEETLLEKVKKKIPKIFRRGEGYQQPADNSPKLPTPPKQKPTPTDQFIAGFSTTFNTFILPVIIVFLCSLAGSIAANDAIGRSPGIRLVYFIYGTIPIFSPLVLIYYIFRYFMKTYPVWYNFLPLTTWHPDNSFLSAILKPFIFDEDANTKYMFQQFDKSAVKWVNGDVSMANSSNNSGGTGGTGGTGTSANNSKKTNQNSKGGPTGTNSKSPSGPTGTNSTSPSGPTGTNSKSPSGPTGTNSKSPTGPTGFNSTSPSGPTGI